MKVIRTESAPKAIGPYSHGIVVDKWFFSSGQIENAKNIDDNIPNPAAFFADIPKNNFNT